MPYPNEHAARVKEPDNFKDDSFRRKEIAPGISIILGKLKDGGGDMVIQAYRFDKDEFTPKQAKAWLKEKETDYISFESASEEVKKAMPITMTFNQITNALSAALAEEFGTNKSNPINSSWVTIIDVHPVGEVICNYYVGTAPGDYFKFNWTIDADGKAKLSNKSNVERVESFIAKPDSGKIIKKIEEERYVLGIVLEPEVEDAQGDIYSEEEIRKACHNFMEDYRAQVSQIGIMHKKKTMSATVVENYLIPADLVIEGRMVRKGTWLMGTKIHKKDIWEKVKNGIFKGYSVGGSAGYVYEDI